jgi:uncharacterized protein with GYD domain
MLNRLGIEITLGVSTMAKYLITGSYTAEAWAAQIADPKNRIEAVRPAFEKMGGSIESAYLSFGAGDLVFIAEMPDNISAAALSMAVSAGGGVANLQTTPLISMEDAVAAMTKAAEITYAPPGS